MKNKELEKNQHFKFLIAKGNFKRDRKLPLYIILRMDSIWSIKILCNMFN